MSSIQDTLNEIDAALQFVLTRLQYLEEITQQDARLLKLSEHGARINKEGVPTSYSYGMTQKEKLNCDCVIEEEHCRDYPLCQEPNGIG